MKNVFVTNFSGSLTVNEGCRCFIFSFKMDFVQHASYLKVSYHRKHKAHSLSAPRINELSLFMFSSLR